MRQMRFARHSRGCPHAPSVCVRLLFAEVPLRVLRSICLRCHANRREAVAKITLSARRLPESRRQASRLDAGRVESIT